MTERKQNAWEIRSELYNRALYLIHNELFDEFFHEGQRKNKTTPMERDGHAGWLMFTDRIFLNTSKRTRTS